MSTTGEKPGRGIYRCTKCNEVVLIIDEYDLATKKWTQ